MTPQPNFKDYIFNYFLEWEKTQPKKRSSFSAFARWLSENSSNTKITQQVVDGWMNGSKPRDYKYVLILAEKIGNEIYDVLEMDRPNILHLYTSRNWDKAPKKVQQELAKIISKYTNEPIPDETREKQATKPR